LCHLHVSFNYLLETYCLTVAAWVAGGEVACVEFPDHLAAAELVVHRHDAVAATFQIIEGCAGKTVFDAHFHALHDAEARSVTRRLRVLFVVCNTPHHLRVALRLHGASHHSETHYRLAVLRDKPGNDRLVGTFAWPHAVRMTRLKHKAGAAIL